jgi:branched-chain amino acid transport system permease protein
MSAEQLLHAAVNALVLGSLLGLIAVGYSLVYGVARLLNFAHGEIFVLGGYYAYFLTAGAPPAAAARVAGLSFAFVAAAAYSLQDRAGTLMTRLVVSAVAAAVVAAAVGLGIRATLPLPLAVPLACAATVAAALFLERVAYRPLAGGDRLNYLISAVGMSLALQGGMQVLFGTERRRFPDSVRTALLFLQEPVEWVGLAALLTGLDALIVLVSGAAVVAVSWLVRRTDLGLKVRAVADDPDLARHYGVDPTRAHLTAFVIGAVLACVAAIFFVARESALEPTFGYQQGLLAFAAAVLGGIGRVEGAFAGGVVIGVVLSFVPLVPLEAAVNHLLGDAAAYLPSAKGSDWSYGLVYLTMIALLVFRPGGLLGGGQRRVV